MKLHRFGLITAVSQNFVYFLIDGACQNLIEISLHMYIVILIFEDLGFDSAPSHAMPFFIESSSIYLFIFKFLLMTIRQ